MKHRGKFSGLVAAVLFTLSGCRRETTPPPPLLPPAAAPPKVEPAAAPAPTTAISTPAPAEQPIRDRLPAAPDDSSLRFPVQKELTSAVHLYQMDHQQLPVDFTVLVKEKYLKAMPAPPPGKRFGLDRRRLQVVVMDSN